MTATPLRHDNRDTYKYFGNPLYTYSLRQRIDDGFLAPYRVHASSQLPTPPAGDRPKANLTRSDARFRMICTATKDFERQVALRKRTEAIATNLSEFLKRLTGLPRPSCSA